MLFEEAKNIREESHEGLVLPLNLVYGFAIHLALLSEQVEPNEVLNYTGGSLLDYSFEYRIYDHDMKTILKEGVL